MASSFIFFFFEAEWRGEPAAPESAKNVPLKKGGKKIISISLIFIRLRMHLEN